MSELGKDRYKVRKIEFFQDGDIGYTSEEKENFGTKLDEVLAPSLEEINLDSQFKGRNINIEEFESLRNNYVQQNT